MGAWDSYIMIEGDEQVVSFWKDPDRPQGKTLLMMGEGFDPRMNNVLRAFAVAGLAFDCKNIVHGDRRRSSNKAMVEKIRSDLGLTSLAYQRLDDLVAAIGLPKEKLCTYCWTGKDVSDKKCAGCANCPHKK